MVEGEERKEGQVRCAGLSARLVCPLGPAISRQPKWGINDDLVRARPPDGIDGNDVKEEVNLKREIKSELRRKDLVWSSGIRFLSGEIDRPGRDFSGRNRVTIVTLRAALSQSPDSG